MKANVKVLEYSEKCIAVIGDTKPIKDELKAIGGKFNPYLKHDGLTVAGWVFGLKRRNEVLALIGNEAEQVTPEPVVKPNEPVICGSNEPIIEPQPEPQRAEKPKPVKKEKTPEFKVMVKCTGFIEMERVFTSEKEMVKFCKQQKSAYDEQIDRVIGVPFYNKGKERFNENFGTQKWKEQVEKFKKDIAKAGIEPLKIEFINLV